MWLSLNIIRDMVDLDGIAPEEIAARLTMATAEIDGIDAVNRHFETVVTAKIIDVKKHPNADKLTVCDLDAGNEKLTVVCGAPNHKKGDIVALATVGTKLSEEFTVTETKVRGVNSPGMLCSEKELGLSDDHSGIMIFPADTPIGVPLSRLYPDRVDVRLEIDNKSITHRPDLWCHAGFAREIAALFGRAFKHPVDLSIAKTFTNSEPLTVTIHAPEAAPRYCGLVVKNIRIEESPEWLKSRVSSIGMRPINNVVDVTNYVMAEIGEPMHAFDRKKLRGNEIIVRTATDGEPMKTLDEQEHTLTAHDVAIAAGQISGSRDFSKRRSARRRSFAAMSSSSAWSPRLRPSPKSSTPIPVNTRKTESRRRARSSERSSGRISTTPGSPASSRRSVLACATAAAISTLRRPPTDRPRTSPYPTISWRKWDASSATTISPPSPRWCPARRRPAMSSDCSSGASRRYSRATTGSRR
ncbi:MAG TPA: phenylalanine--tRNA ligase subunit beta [Spirochaetota bacterium]|nr:phenylalanine--tRNA ligase subunit beta [Spirochaetota bacterium]